MRHDQIQELRGKIERAKRARALGGARDAFALLSDVLEELLRDLEAPHDRSARERFRDAPSGE